MSFNPKTIHYPRSDVMRRAQAKQRRWAENGLLHR